MKDEGIPCAALLTGSAATTPPAPPSQGGERVFAGRVSSPLNTEHRAPTLNAEHGTENREP